MVYWYAEYQISYVYCYCDECCKYIGKFNIRFLLLFVYICLITTVVELAATYIIELCGTPFTVLWDYSNHFMNFDGRICLDASARFGVLGLMIIYGALPLKTGDIYLHCFY